jgi:hypothetical protein
MKLWEYLHLESIGKVETVRLGLCSLQKQLNFVWSDVMPVQRLHDL